MEYIDSQFTDFQHIYTDGSRSREGTGSSFVVPSEGVGQTQSNSRICTSYTAELMGIKMALKWSLRDGSSHILILSDCLGALNAIESLSCNSHYLVAEILNIIHEIEIHERKVAFLWIPSHCNILGNEGADRMAKSATSDRLTGVTKVTLQEANYHVHNEIRSKWEEAYTSSSTGQHYRKLFPTIFVTNCLKMFSR